MPEWPACLVVRFKIQQKARRTMQYLDLTYTTPAENLACDEALLDLCESGLQGETLRFWESPSHFAVLGYGNHADRELNIEACHAANIPILRRCSGGGTVLQGPGCLNYALILRIDRFIETENIGNTNCYIMSKHRDALRSLGFPVQIAGHTDLILGGPPRVKFSGNSQRRRRASLLFHGTFLHNFDLGLLEKTLNFPSLQPDYRENRPHAAFVSNLRITQADLKTALQNAWQADSVPNDLQPIHVTTATLTANKYLLPSWNLKV
jgi:lipoate-protein ligase A